MNHHDAEITDVVVVLDGRGNGSVNATIDKLKELGLQVVDIKSDEGVIEGSIDSGRVPDLKKVPGVCYVRSVFTYVADYPTGDPRDLDSSEPSVDDPD